MNTDLFQVMPPLSANEFAELKADIAARGVMVPIEYDETGAVLDGHHRLKACAELGIKEWPSVVRLGMDAQAKTLHAIKLNCARRHLTTAGKQQAIQKALQAAPEKSDRQLARAMGVSQVTVGAQRKKLEESVQIEHFPTRQDPRTGRLSQPAVKLISIQVSSPSQVRCVAEKATAVLDAAQDDPAFSRLVDQMARSGKVNAAAKQLAKIQAAETIDAEPLPMPSGPFRVIVADPPWLYGNRADDISHRSANPYPSMSIAEICALPIETLAHDDCLLWLWTTNAHMRESYAVLDAWGFQPKTILTWVKDRIGTGDWLRGQTEHCHLAVRGKPTILTSGHSTVLNGPLRDHSQKPESFFELVETICPGSKLELFCRAPRDGWSVWGNEATDDSL